MESREGSGCSLTMATATATVRDARKLFDDLRQAHKDNRQLKLRCLEDQTTIAALRQQVEEERTNGSVVRGLRADLASAEARESALQQQLTAAEEKMGLFQSLLTDRDSNDETRDAEIDELNKRIAELEEERKADIIARDRLNKEASERQQRLSELEAALKIEQFDVQQWSVAVSNFKRGLDNVALLRADATAEEIPQMREKCNNAVEGMRQTIDRQTQKTRLGVDTPPPAAASPGSSGGTTPHTVQPPMSARSRSMSVRHADPNEVPLPLPESGSSLFSVTLLDPLTDLMTHMLSIIDKANDGTQRAIAPNTMRPKTTPGSANSASPSQDKSSAKALGFWAKR